MRRFIVLLAAVMPVALAIGLATVAVGAAPAALAATTCHDEGEWYDLPDIGTVTDTAQFMVATTDTTSDTANVVSVISDVGPFYLYEGNGYAEWCQVTTGATYGDATFYEYRLQGTSDCATYAGPVAGTQSGAGFLYLQPCSKTIAAQEWQVSVVSGDSPADGPYTLTTEYQDENTAYGCLSADALSQNDIGDSTNLVLVDTDMCAGDGGQSWEYTGSTPPGGN